LLNHEATEYGRRRLSYWKYLVLFLAAQKAFIGHSDETGPDGHAKAPKIGPFFIDSAFRQGRSSRPHVFS